MQRQKPPKVPLDGPGPRGAGDCYYTSRILNSTFRYERFVKKLRQTEEEQRKGEVNRLKVVKDHQTSNFFLHCDRKSRVNDVARRVDLCMRSYQTDLEEKKKRLVALYTVEEQDNIRKFVEQAQAGVEALWQAKLDRLQYLLDKRRKEHEEKYKDTPISKCVHAMPCLVHERCKEAQKIQLYQIKEKEARKMAERELEEMWQEVAMKESEALAARMEKDALDRYRRDMDCLAHSDNILEQRRQQRQRDLERLKAEQKAMKMKFDEDTRKEKEAEERQRQKRLDTAKNRAEALEQRRQKLEKKKEEDKMIQDTWDSLTGQGLAETRAQLELRRRREMDHTLCNQEMVKLKDNLTKLQAADDAVRKEVAKQQQSGVDEQRCKYLMWSKKQNREVRQAMIDQIQDRKNAKDELHKKLREEDEYHRQLFKQTQELIDSKAARDLQDRKNYQHILLEQIEYNKLLKERARQEELDQIRKSELARQEYDQEIKKMLARPFYSEAVHPFMQQMSKGMKMVQKCPCSKPDYCAEREEAKALKSKQ